MNNLIPFLTFFVSYLIGSFPTAYVVGQLHPKRINIFERGSGNMGANNVGRTLGYKYGILVWALDCLKGMLGILVARMIMPNDFYVASVLGGIAVVIGHNWSVIASLITGRLRGGKGASTALGTWVMMTPPQVIIATLVVWAAIVFITRYVSLGVLLGVLVGVIWLMVMISQETTGLPTQYTAHYALYAILVAAMIYIRHWENIVKLIKGNERRLGERA